MGQFTVWSNHEQIRCFSSLRLRNKWLLEASPGLTTLLLPHSSMLKMSLDSSLLDTLVVPWQELRPETPMELPPAPTNMLTPTVSSRLSTMLLTQSTDSELPAPTSQLDQLSLLLLLLRLQSLTSQSQLPLRIPQRLLLPRLNSRLLLMRPPPLLLREERERLKRSLLLLLQLSLLSHTHMPLDSTLPMLDSQLLPQLFSQLLPLCPMPHLSSLLLRPQPQLRPRSPPPQSSPMPLLQPSLPQLSPTPLPQLSLLQLPLLLLLLPQLLLPLLPHPETLS